MRSNLEKVSLLLNKVNTDNKLSLFWYDLKTRIKYAIPYKYRDFWYHKVRTIYKPQHSRIRNSVPKHWIDLDGVLITVNFEIIKSFYEDEYKDGVVDWNSDAKHKKFAKWLEQAYKYVAVDRAILENKIENAYPDLSKVKSGKKTYKELYGKVGELEKEMFDKDTKVIYELLKNREFLWT